MAPPPEPPPEPPRVASRGGRAAAIAGGLPRDVISGVAALAFCGVAYWMTLGFPQAPPALAQYVQPAGFPQMVIAVIALLSGVMILLGLRQPVVRARRLSPPVFTTAAMMLVFVVVFQTLGLLSAIGGFAFAMPLLWGERRWGRLLAYALLLPAAIYLVFVLGFDVYFEPGPIEAGLEALSSRLTATE